MHIEILATIHFICVFDLEFSSDILEVVENAAVLRLEINRIVGHGLPVNGSTDTL